MISDGDVPANTIGGSTGIANKPPWLRIPHKLPQNTMMVEGRTRLAQKYPYITNRVLSVENNCFVQTAFNLVKRADDVIIPSPEYDYSDFCVSDYFDCNNVKSGGGEGALSLSAEDAVECLYDAVGKQVFCEYSVTTPYRPELEIGDSILLSFADGSQYKSVVAHLTQKPGISTTCSLEVDSSEKITRTFVDLDDVSDSSSPLTRKDYTNPEDTFTYIGTSLFDFFIHTVDNTFSSNYLNKYFSFSSSNETPQILLYLSKGFLEDENPDLERSLGFIEAFLMGSLGGRWGEPSLWNDRKHYAGFPRLRDT